MNLCLGLSPLQLARTERLNNTSSPAFSQRLKLDYHFEKVQNLKLGLYDIDNSSSDLGDDDYLGGVELTLGQVHTKTTNTKLSRNAPLFHWLSGKRWVNSPQCVSSSDCTEAFFVDSLSEYTFVGYAGLEAMFKTETIRPAIYWIRLNTFLILHLTNIQLIFVFSLYLLFSS